MSTRMDSCLADTIIPPDSPANRHAHRPLLQLMIHGYCTTLSDTSRQYMTYGMSVHRSGFLT